MAGFLKKTSVVLGVLGILGALILAKNAGGQNHYFFDWEAALLVFLCGALGVFCLSIFIYWMGEVAEHLSNIAKSLNNIEIQNKQNDNYTYSKDNSWKCRTCGRQNPIYNTTCTCGSKKEDNI